MEEINLELILHRLDEISESQKNSLLQLARMEQKLAKVDKLSDDVYDIKDWKKEIQDTLSNSELKELKLWKSSLMNIASPKQLDELINEVNKLKVFKTQSTTIWIVGQAIISLIIALSIFYK